MELINLGTCINLGKPGAENGRSKMEIYQSLKIQQNLNNKSRWFKSRKQKRCLKAKKILFLRFFRSSKRRLRSGKKRRWLKRWIIQIEVWESGNKKGRLMETKKWKESWKHRDERGKEGEESVDGGRMQPYKKMFSIATKALAYETLKFPFFIICRTVKLRRQHWTSKFF